MPTVELSNDSVGTRAGPSAGHRVLAPVRGRKCEGSCPGCRCWPCKKWAAAWAACRAKGDKPGEVVVFCGVFGGGDRRAFCSSDCAGDGVDDEVAEPRMGEAISWDNIPKSGSGGEGERVAAEACQDCPVEDDEVDDLGVLRLVEISWRAADPKSGSGREGERAAAEARKDCPVEDDEVEDLGVLRLLVEITRELPPPLAPLKLELLLLPR